MLQSDKCQGGNAEREKNIKAVFIGRHYFATICILSLRSKMASASEEHQGAPDSELDELLDSKV